MTRIEETSLPGVGVRHDFQTRTGVRVGVISHRGGRRELLVYDREDPDACRELVRLDEDEGHTLAELLGGTSVTEHLGSLRQQVEGMTIDWVRVEDGSFAAGKALRDCGLRTDAGSTVVAVIREGVTTPAPRGEFVLEAEDTAVLVGSPEGLVELTSLLRRG